MSINPHPINTPPFISVIIPTTNAAETFAATLNSLMLQEFKNFEIIVVDGASQDDTVNIAKKYIDKHKDLKIISEPDSGVYDAMNKGIKAASGEWIYFLGSNDVLIDANIFSELNKLISTGYADFIYGDVILKSNNNRYGGAFDLNRLLWKENICHQSIFYHRSVFEKVGYFNLNYKIYADWDMNIRCFRHTGFRIKYVDMVIALFNDTNGISRQYDPVFYKELPVYHINRYNEMETIYKDKIFQVLDSNAYKIGTKIVTVLKGVRDFFMRKK